jgi:hypothetical protein
MKFNNVLKSLKTSLAIVLVVILASCAKQLPKPSKEVKSILVIPVEVVNKTQIDRKFDYVFYFQSKSTSGTWSNSPQYDQLFSVRGNLQRNGNSLTIVSGLSHGEHRLFSMAEKPINVRNVNPNTKRVGHRPFVLEEGKVLIFPDVFRYSQESIGAMKSFRYSSEFDRLTDQELKNIKEELKEYKNYELWSLQDKKADGALTELVTSTASSRI